MPDKRKDKKRLRVAYQSIRNEGLKPLINFLAGLIKEEKGKIESTKTKDKKEGNQ